MKNKSFLKRQKIRLKVFFRSLSLSRANNASLLESPFAVSLRKHTDKLMLKGVVDQNMRS
jgi:hypothetical protein